MAHASLYTNKNKVDIAFIQEPYSYNGGPVAFHRPICPFMHPLPQIPELSCLLGVK